MINPYIFINNFAAINVIPKIKKFFTECYSGKLHNLILMFAILIMPLVLVSTAWTQLNNYPFGNHDAGFHYARAMGDKTLYEQYFGVLNMEQLKYYNYYPPLTALVLSFGIRFIPLPAVLMVNIIAFALITAIMWLFHYYTKSDIATFMLFTSSFVAGYFSTYARLIFIILMFIFLIAEKYRWHSTFLIGLTHSFGIYYFLAGILISSLIKDVKSKAIYLILKFTLAASVLYGILFRQIDLAFFPFLIGGILVIEWLTTFELVMLMIATLGFQFFDTTIAMFMCLFLAIAIGRYFDNVKIDLPKWLTYLIVALILISYYTDVLTITALFMNTSITTLGLNYQLLFS